MLFRKLIIPVLITVIGLGGLTYYASLNGAFGGNGTLVVTTGTNNSGTSGIQAYDCASPAINTQKLCDKLPVGYQIAPKLVYGPSAQCFAGMTDSACSLLKQTFANGVCDPNETVWTDPLDCGCTGSIVGDPFTGRCGVPATVCQLQATQETLANQRKGAG